MVTVLGVQYDALLLRRTVRALSSTPCLQTQTPPVRRWLVTPSLGSAGRVIQNVAYGIGFCKSLLSSWLRSKTDWA